MSEETNVPPAALPPAPSAAEVRYEKCPHCGNSTLIEPSAALIYRCGICGKARIPMELPGHTRTDAEVPALARASLAHTTALAWKAGSIFLAAFALLGLGAFGLVMTAMNPGMLPGFFALLIALIPAVLAGVGFQRAKASQAQVAPGLDEAWRTAAREVLDAKGSIGAAALGRTLKVPEERAEQLLVELAATTSVRHRIEDQDPLTFEASRARVAESTTSAAEGADEDASAAQEAEDLAALEAAREQKRRGAGS